MSAPYIVTRPLVTNGSLSPPTQGGGVRFDSALPPDPIHCLPVEIKAKSGYLHDTLQQIDDLANEDVEMQAPISELAVYVVVDTNILLHHFEVLTNFVNDVERLTLPVIVVVPGAVVLELDGQKNRDGLGWMSRNATSWLLEKIRQRRSVKGQAQEETCKSTRNWKIKERGELSSGDMYNDSLILDCCLYFARDRPTVLFTADNNLCIMCQAQGLPSITPTRSWTARDLAAAIYGDLVDVRKFTDHREQYRPQDKKRVAEDDDKMMVDDEGGEAHNQFQSQHILSMLHEQVVDHFTRLLIELVGRVGGEEVRQRTTPEEEAQMSRHAPRKRHYSEWSVQECLEYLTTKRKVKEENPRASTFLKKAYRGQVARSGREFSRQDWRVALSNLKAIGEVWEDVAITESIYFLQPHIEQVFEMPLKP